MAQKLGYFKDAGLDVSIETPVGPLGADQGGRRRPHRPGDLLRAGGRARPRTGPRRGRRRRPRRPAADLDDLAEEIGDQGIADLRGKTIATAGIPYQDAYLKTILARAHLSPSDVNAVNVGFGLLPAMRRRQGAGDARRLQQRRGRRPARTRRAPGRHPGRQARRADLRRARPGRPARAARRRPGAGPALPRRPLARHGGRGRRPAGGGRGAARSQPGPRTEAGRSGARGDPAAALAERLDEPGRVDEVHRLDARQRPDRLAAGAGEVLDDSYLPGKISE